MKLERRYLLSRFFVFLLSAIPGFVIYFTLADSEEYWRQKAIQECVTRNRQNLEFALRCDSPIRQATFLTARLSKLVKVTLEERIESGSVPSLHELVQNSIRSLNEESISVLLKLPHEGMFFAVKRGESQSHLNQADLVARFGTDMGLMSFAGKLAAYFVSPNEDELVKLDLTTEINRMTDGVASAEVYKDGSKGRLRCFPTRSGMKGFFWNEYIPFEDAKCSVVMLFYISLTDPPADFSRLAQVAVMNAEHRDNIGIAYFDEKCKNAIASKMFLENPHLQKIIEEPCEADLTGRKIGALFEEESSAADIRMIDGNIILSSMEHDRDDDCLLLAACSFSLDLSIARTIAGYLAFLFPLMPLILVSSELFLLKREIQLSFSQKIIGAFFLFSVLPLSFTCAVAESIIRELLHTDIFEAKESLKSSFQDIENGFNEYAAEQSTIMEDALNNPDLTRGLIRCEQTFQDSGGLNRLQRLVAKHIEPLRAADMSLNSTVIFGRYDFNAAYPVKDSEYPGFRKFFRGFSNRILDAMNAEIESNDPGRNLPHNRTADYIAEIGADAMADGMIALQGFEPISRIMTKPRTLTKMQTGIVIRNLLPVPIYEGGRMRYFAIGAYDGSKMVERYINRILSTKSDESYRKKSGMDLIAIDKWDMSVFPRNARVDSGMIEVIQHAGEMNSAINFLDAEKEAFIEAVPGKIIPGVTLAGRLNFRLLTDAFNRNQKIFYTLLLCLVMFFFVLAIACAEVFLVPIRYFTEASRRVKDGDLNLELVWREENEFGALASAFNSMLKGLKEGRILGRFVSESVKQAALDGNLEKLAGEAQMLDTTVVFCGLCNFDELRNHASVERLVQILEKHLSIVSDCADKYRAEIDKIIGEKIMLVFDHRRFENPTCAVRAALNFAVDVYEKSTGTPVLSETRPAIGLNSGKALSGILGSPNVHLDYTVIGDTVNLAARLATLAQISTGSRIILSGTTLELAPEETRAEKLPIKKVKGKSREVDVYLLSV